MFVWQRSGYTLSPLNSSVHIPNRTGWYGVSRNIHDIVIENEIYEYNEV